MELGEGLRLGMRRLASGVCVVSTEADGKRFAMTASSVTSLSDSPASLLVCVNAAAAIRPFLVKGHAFTVNILGAGQEEISNSCARSSNGEDRFNVGQWSRPDEPGAPFLKQAQAIFFCEVDNDTYQYGTHHIVIGRVNNVLIPGAEISPLIYLNGKYQRIA
ncbi:MAG: flavin reductase (DIM6/NTAB) family NADH-FMN oxidoreductase RutF [Pseudohongiellaceae bacterium]|jgi:flavin reductase (DIM6/NTAB) family NADH-FMN oxidoreductase RutF